MQKTAKTSWNTITNRKILKILKYGMMNYRSGPMKMSKLKNLQIR